MESWGVLAVQCKVCWHGGVGCASIWRFCAPHGWVPASCLQVVVAHNLNPACTQQIQNLSALFCVQRAPSCALWHILA